MAWVQHLQDVGIGLGIALTVMRILKEAGIPRPKFDARIEQVVREYRRSQEEVGENVAPAVHELNAVILMLAQVNADQERALEDQRQKTDALAMQVAQLIKQADERSLE